MGCTNSKSGLSAVDDSMHVMMKHDRKAAQKRGERTDTGYVPRAPHPLLSNSSNNINNNINNNKTTEKTSEAAAQATATGAEAKEDKDGENEEDDAANTEKTAAISAKEEEEEEGAAQEQSKE